MPDDASEGPPGARCPGIERLDEIAGGGPAASDSAHLAACERCRSLLAEMRAANQFLDRLRSGAPRSASPSPAQGIEVPGYDIRGVASVGGQGAVYRAVQRGTGKDVAIKVPHADSLNRPSARFRFQREIEITARLDHPGIVRVLGACELSDSRVGCVMEFVEGRTFDRWAEIARAREGGIRLIVEAGERVADAIAYAHLRAVMHRDIKPGNVLVTREGVPRVLDFGLAKALNDSRGTFTTLTGAFVGTLAYAAPEQIMSGADAIDLRTDVYGIGLLLYQALTGRLPHAHEAPTSELLRQIREVDPPKPSSIHPAIGDELDAIILKALAKDKDRRYASASELRDDLRAWLEGRAVRARFDSRWYVMRKYVRRHRGLAITAGAVLLAGATIAALALVAREQATRARVADAVSSARAIDSHWVRMGEARAIAADNFEPGEKIAWDALLEPDPALDRAGIERFDASGPSRTSPAYWALWEISLRTPIRFTVPVVGDPLPAYDDTSGLLALLRPGQPRVEWWDWQGERVAHTLDLDRSISPSGLTIVPTTGLLVATDFHSPAYVILPDRSGVYPLDPDRPSLGAYASPSHVVTTVQADSGGFEVRIWRTTTMPPALTRSMPMQTRPSSLALDASGRFLAVVMPDGEVRVIDPESGRIVLQRSAELDPKFRIVTTRGIPAEFILVGSEKIAVVKMDGDPVRDLDEALQKRGWIVELRSLVGASGGDRSMAVTDRWRLGVARKSDPITEGVYLPAISAWAPTLSSDGRYAALRLRPSRRAAVLDLEFPGIRRLPFDADVTRSGFATISDIEFSADSRTLLAGAMDGTARAFDTSSAASRTLTTVPIDEGVTAISVMGDQVIAGTHVLRGNRAMVARIRDGNAETIALGGDAWISDIESDKVIWTLEGNGRLRALDPESAALRREITLPRNNESWARALARLEARGLLVAGPAAEGIAVLEGGSLEVIASVRVPSPMRKLAPHPIDPDVFASAHDDGVVRLWRVSNAPRPIIEPIGELGTHAGSIFALAFSPDGRIIATGGGSPEVRDVRLWDAQNARELASFDLFESGVFDVAFSPDGRWLAASGEIRLSHPREGGQLFLIDLRLPDRCIAGNLEYHIARFAAEHGREPRRAEVLRRWAETVRAR